MKFVTYNIQYGKGKDGRFDLGRIADEVRGADVIALQEVERFWTRSGNVDQPRELAALLPEYYWHYGPGLDMDASTIDDDGHVRHRRRQFGNMLLSRTPLRTVRNHLLPKYASTGPMSLQRAALEACIENLRIYSVHLTHLSSDTRGPQIQQLLAIHRNAGVEGTAIDGGGLKSEWKQDGLPDATPTNAVLMGDFNFTPGSANYDAVLGPVSDYGGRITNPLGFVDAWVGAGHEQSAGVTSDIRGKPVRLDYFFVSATLASNISTVRIDSQATGSDHQPVWMVLDL